MAVLEVKDVEEVSAVALEEESVTIPKKKPRT